MNRNRIKDDIGILIFAAILAFTFILAFYGRANDYERANKMSRLDYRVMQGKQEIAHAKR